MTSIYALALWVLGSMMCSTAFSQSVPVYVYHDDAPYWIDNQVDLSQQWVAQFNQKQASIKLELKHIERPTLNAMVESGQPYIILWANELWFKRRDPNVLSSELLFWDADTLVSLVDSPIDFNRAEQLQGLKIGARSGHYYSDFNPLFKSGRITRVDAKSSPQNYKLLSSGKINAFLDSRSTIAYLQKNNDISSNIYVSLNPQDAYSRHVLVSKQHKGLLPIINKVILEMKNDQAWQMKLESWGISKLVNPFELDLEELNEI
jgi:hypothetical protein